jgi:hypothetical protein
VADSAEDPVGVIVCHVHAPVYPVHVRVRAQEEEAQVAPRSSAGLTRAFRNTNRKELTPYDPKHGTSKLLDSVQYR